MQEAVPMEKPSLASRFFHDLFRMPSWHRYVLLAAMAFGAIGIVGRVRQFTGAGTTPQSSVTATPQGGTSGTPQSNFGATDNSTAAPAPDANAQPWYLSPRFLSIGSSVIGGFIIGWALRVFVKITLTVGVAITALLGALSYFHVMNVDLTMVQQNYHSDMSWLTDQTMRLKDVAMNHLPVHAGGFFGMFMGFRRPKV
jgi:uncharacterized membrane protein (Fun14 family)